jgi:hypothetical protein
MEIVLLALFLFLGISLIAITPARRNRKRDERRQDEVTHDVPVTREAGAEATTLLATLDEKLARSIYSDHGTQIGRWCIEQASSKLASARQSHVRRNWRPAASEAWTGLLYVQVASAINAEYLHQRGALAGAGAQPAPTADAAAPEQDYCNVGNARFTDVNREWLRLGQLLARAKAMLEHADEKFPQFVDVHTDLARAEDYFKETKSAQYWDDAQELSCAGVFFADLAIEIAASYLATRGKAISFASSSADTQAVAPPNSNSGNARTMIQTACRGILLAGQICAAHEEETAVAKFHLYLALQHVAKAKAKFRDNKFGASRYEAAQGWFHANLAREAIDTYASESALLQQGQPGTIGIHAGAKQSEYSQTGYRDREKGQLEWRRLALTIVKLEVLLAVRYPTFEDKSRVLETANSYDVKADQVELWTDVGTIVEKGLRFIESAAKRIESR